MTSATRAAEAFRTRHGRSPDGVWSAPGRVNLIGEHTDYNDGFVLPFALPHRIAVAAAPRSDGLLTIGTLGDNGPLQEVGPLAIAELAPGGVPGWAAYPAGVAWVLRENRVPLRGADLIICGNVPTGAGLSSSAALECAVALALLGLADRAPGGDTAGAPTLPELAKWAQRAENDFVGAPTGVLDQTASLCCAEAHVLFLDVRAGTLEQVPFDAAREGLEILVVDTRTHHAHSDGEYGARRAGCERAAELLGVAALRDIGNAALDTALARLPDELRPLVRHVVTENDRVLASVELLHAGRIAELGPLLTASHESLRTDYRVSAEALDLTVDAALAAGALGARMTGGGFGGSAIALIRVADRDAVERMVRTAFARRNLAAPRLFSAVPSPGAGVDAPAAAATR